MFTIRQAVSTSDNDQVKAAKKNYMNVKPVCICYDCVTKIKKVSLKNFRILLILNL